MRNLLLILLVLCSIKLSNCVQSCSTCSDCNYIGCSKTSAGVERWGFACGNSQACLLSSGTLYGPYTETNIPANKCTYTSSGTSWYDCPDKITSCPGGQYLQDNYCYSCPPNSFCIGGTANYQPCRSACSKGQYQQLDCSVNANRVCIDCPSGYYCPTGSLALIYCPPNTNSPSLSTDLINCTANPGFYGLPGTVSTACPSGTYMTGSGYTSVSACLSCPSGKYNNGIAQTTCKTCNPAVSTTSATSCTCPAGMYHNLSDVNAECNNCPAGSFSTYNDLYDPLLFYTSNDRNEFPMIASPEEWFCGYGPVYRQDHYLSRNGLVWYANCAGIYRWGFVLGYYYGSVCSGGWSCLKTIYPNYEMCIYCPRNYYNPTPGQTSCLLCPFNTTTTGQTFATTCQKCASATGCCQPGTYLKNSSDQFCTPCSFGSYNANQDQTSCTACGAGTYTTSSGTVYAYNCISCSAGTYSSSVQQEATLCMVCSIGTFASQLGAAECSMCGIGTYGSQLGATACIACETGKYVNQTGSSLCISCPIGYYQSATQQSACNICAQGTYSNVAGSSLCISCPIGYYQSAMQQSACNICAQGTYSYLAGSSLCISCPIGYYQSAMQQSACNICAQGTYSTILGATACNACPPGLKCSGGFNILACQNGTTFSLGNQSTCTNCTSCSRGEKISRKNP